MRAIFVPQHWIISQPLRNWVCNLFKAHLQLVEDHPVAVLLLGVEAVRPPAVELVDQPIQIPLILFILDNFLVWVRVHHLAALPVQVDHLPVEVLLVHPARVPLVRHLVELLPGQMDHLPVEVVPVHLALVPLAEHHQVPVQQAAALDLAVRDL